MTTGRKQFFGGKKAYVSPRLVVYGDLKRITAGGVKGGTEDDNHNTKIG